MCAMRCIYIELDQNIEPEVGCKQSSFVNERVLWFIMVSSHLLNAYYKYIIYLQNIINLIGQKIKPNKFHQYKSRKETDFC